MSASFGPEIVNIWHKVIFFDDSKYFSSFQKLRKEIGNVISNEFNRVGRK
jgi:hypothetical protein